MILNSYFHESFKLVWFVFYRNIKSHGWYISEIEVFYGLNYINYSRNIGMFVRLIFRCLLQFRKLKWSYFMLSISCSKLKKSHGGRSLQNRIAYFRTRLGIKRLLETASGNTIDFEAVNCFVGQDVYCLPSY